MAALPMLRVARRCAGLARSRHFYCDGLGVSLPADHGGVTFEGPDGYSALIVDGDCNI